MDTAANQSKVHIERDRNGLYGLHVSNISPDLNEHDLRGLFYTAGFIKVCKIIRVSGNLRVAFVKFENHEEALKALQKVHGTKIGEFTLEVRPAYESHRWKTNKNNKESMEESSAKHDDKTSGRLSPVCNGEQENNVQKFEKETVNKASGNQNRREDNHVVPPRTYVLPPASQDARYYSNGSSSSLSSLADKTPVKPTAFNKVPSSRGRDTQKRTPSNQEELRKPKPVTPPTTGIVRKCSNDSPPTKPMDKMSLTDQPEQTNNNVFKWSEDDVAIYFERQDECTTSMLTFIRDQEIDGNALMLIEESSLLHFMKLGPALKFLNLREKLRI